MSSTRVGFHLCISVALWTGVAAASDDSGPSGPPVPMAPVHLRVGEQRLVRIQGLERFSVGGDSVHVTSLDPRKAHRNAETPLQTSSLMIKGVRPGGADLWVWRVDGSTETRSIRVDPEPAHGSVPHETAAHGSLAEALNGLDETEVLLTSEGVILRGTVSNSSEATRVSALVRGFPQSVRDETEPSEGLILEGERKLKAWLENSKLTGLRIERISQAVWLRGSVSDAKMQAQVEREARLRFPKVELDVQSLSDSSPVVHFKVFLLEIRKNRFGALGVQWPDLIPQAASLTTQMLRDTLRLDLAIQALEGEGSARVLSNPELVVRAPGEAELFAGGELPIRMSSQYFSSVNWKPYGLSLKLKVTQVTGEKVRLDIQTEVSHLAPEVNGDAAVPALEANRMKTQVDARFGTPLLLSGLLKQDYREKTRGLPLLQKIPILGMLFGSEDFQNERSELVAILLPHASPPPPPLSELERQIPRGQVPLPRNAMTLEQEHELRADRRFPWNVFE